MSIASCCAAGFDFDQALVPYRHRGAVAVRLMRAGLIIEADPLADAGFRFAAIAVALEIDVLMLQRAPQPLDEDIVHPPAAAVHRDLDASLSERASEGRAGELAALVGVEDLRLAETRQRQFTSAAFTGTLAQ